MAAASQNAPSGRRFSNTDTGDLPADPYRLANLDTESTLEQKISDLSSFVSKVRYGMMTTRCPNTGNLVSRAMSLAAKYSVPLSSILREDSKQEYGGADLLFHTNTETHKTTELHSDPHVNVSFLDSWGEWASISGIAEIETDRQTVKKYYSPTLRAWLGDLGDGLHDGSENDPRIGVIRVRTNTATYCTTSKGIIGQALDVTQSTVTGKPPNLNRLREISEEDLQSWRSTRRPSM